MSAQNEVSVKVFFCDAAATRSIGEVLVEGTLNGPNRERVINNAMESAKRYMHQGMAVIVRPKYNDISENGRTVGFREWRSFNGEPLQEVVWRIG